MRSVRGAALAIAATAGTCTLLSSAAAHAQPVCPGSGIYTEATCGEDVCSCASPCASPDDCNSGCCVNGFCAVGCACDGGMPDPAVTIQTHCTPPPEAVPSCTAAGGAPLVIALAVVGGAALRGRGTFP